MRPFKKIPIYIELSNSKQKHLRKIALLGCKAKIKLLAGKLDEGYTLVKKTSYQLHDFALKIGQHIPQAWANRWTLERFTDVEKQYSKKLGLPKKFLLAGVLLGMSALPALGQTITVSTGAEVGTGAETSLREAVIQANTDPADGIIYLENGTFHQLSISGIIENAAARGDLDIANRGTLTIICTGTNPAIIDGNNLDRVFHVLTATFTLSNVTVQNGLVNSGNGGGVFNNQGTLTISNSLITENEVGGTSPNGRGAGVYNTGGTTIIQNSTFSLNSATEGGGIFNYNAGVVTLHSSSITDNTSASIGGGVFNSNNGNMSLHSSSIVGNHADTYGGGVFNYNNSTVTLHSSSITGNNVNNRGGGIMNWNNSNIILHSSSIVGNMSVNGNGGGIFSFDNSNVTLHSSSMTGNSAGSSGGGVMNWSSTLTLHSSSMTGNSAGDSGGGIFNYDAGIVSLHCSSIVGNNANLHGGGIFNQDNSTLTVHSSSSIRGNTADNSGGGIFNENSTVRFYASSIDGNTANQRGGGVFNHISSMFELHSSSITGNTASSRGGGVYNRDSQFISSVSSITSNTATTGDGGGIYQRGIANDVVTTLSNTTLSGNTAPAANGGGIFVNQIENHTNTLNLTHVTLANNTAQAGNTGGLYLNRTDGMIIFNPVNSILGGNSNHDFDTNGAGAPNITINTASQVNLVESDISGRAIATHTCPPQLDPLQLIGGTWMHPLKNSSPVIDAGIATAIASDQRGVPHSGNPDLGAYEFGTGGLSCVCLSTPANVTIVWVGCADSDWGNPANWNTGNVPLTSDFVYVPAGTANELIIDEIATCSKFVQQIGAIVRVNFNVGGQLRVLIN